MGQKTNPLGFRLGITQDHKSSWYAKCSNYSELLSEDDKIRSYLSKFTKVANIAMVRIGRSGDGNQIELNIELEGGDREISDNFISSLAPKTVDLINRIKEIIEQKKDKCIVN